MEVTVGFMNRFRELPHPSTPLAHAVEDLSHVLNAQRGYGSSIRELGLSPTDPHNNAEGVAKRLLDDVLANILLYVPDLSEPTLRTLERGADLVLRIELCARLRGEREPVRMLLGYDQVLGSFSVEVARAE